MHSRDETMLCSRHQWSYIGVNVRAIRVRMTQERLDDLMYTSDATIVCMGYLGADIIGNFVWFNIFAR